MPHAISTADRVTCGWERCDLYVFTNQGGTQPRHWVPPDRRDRIVHPGYSGSPVQTVVLDLDGIEHPAVLPATGLEVFMLLAGVCVW